MDENDLQPATLEGVSVGRRVVHETWADDRIVTVTIEGYEPGEVVGILAILLGDDETEETPDPSDPDDWF